MAVPTPATKPRGIRVRTAHATEAEFIAAFLDLCDEGTIFAPTEKMKPIGVDCAFSLELADGSAMVRGLGSIRNAWPTDDSPFGRAGIHITIDQLTTGTEPIFQKLLEARTATAHKPRTRPAPSTHQLWGPPAGPPTEEMLAVEPEEPEVQELPHKITKELKSPSPPEDLTHEAFMEDPAIPGKASRAGTIPNLAPIAPIPHPRLASAPIIPIPVSAADDDALVAKPTPWWLNARVGGVFAAGLLLGLLMSFVFGGGDDDNKKVAASAAPAVVAKAEPANCPPPPEPAALAAAPVEETEAPPPETKARTAKNKQVAAATGPKKVKQKTPSIETKTAAAIKPSAFASIKAATTPTKTSTPSKTTNVAATTKATNTKPTTKTTTKPATVATTKPTTTTTSTKASTTSKTATTSTKTTTKTATKPATVATTKKPKKGACSSLDCL